MHRTGILAFSLLPSILLALFTFGCGTLPGSATALGAGVGMALVLAMALLAGAAPRWWDPLRLERWWGLPWLAWGWLLLGVALSPVPRAGWTAAVLLPAYLLLPRAVARCWGTAEARRLGLRAVALVVLAVAGVALLGALEAGRQGAAGFRAAAPLGHHGPLALWLVLLLPLPLLPLLPLLPRETSSLPGVEDGTPARHGAGRWLGAGIAALAVLAVLATRSLAGAAALGVIALGAVLLLPPSRRRSRWLLLGAIGVGLLPLLLLLPRLGAVATLEDASTQVRRGYLKAGLAGVAERPLVGWGAGAVPWTVAEFLEPEPGVHPPGEVVGQLHSLPLQLAYETGLPGALLVLAVGMLLLRGWWRRPRTTAGDAAALGLLAGGVASLGGVDPGVTALPVALAVLLGAGLSTPPETEGEAEGDLGREARGLRRADSLQRFAVILYALVAMALLYRPMLAQRHYDLAVTLPGSAVLDLRQAIDRDPTFPLYRARGALRGVLPDPPAEALRAAQEARGVAALWLLAGQLGAEDGETWAGEALLRACRLDPLAAAPSYPLARLTARENPDAAAHHAARALLAEPRLAAAELFREAPAVGPAALEKIRIWPGVDEGLKLALLEAAAAQWRSWREDVPAGNDLLLTLSLDGVAADAPSLYLFHRRPWPAELTTIRLLDPLPELLQLPAAPRLKRTAREAFSRETCAPGDPLP